MSCGQGNKLLVLASSSMVASFCPPRQHPCPPLCHRGSGRARSSFFFSFSPPLISRHFLCIGSVLCSYAQSYHRYCAFAHFHNYQAGLTICLFACLRILFWYTNRKPRGNRMCPLSKISPLFFTGTPVLKEVHCGHHWRKFCPDRARKR